MLYVGQKGGVEARIATSAGWQFEGIPAGKLRRYHGSGWRQLFDFPTMVLNLRDSLRVARGLVAATGILRRFKPDVIFIKGGYVGLPVGWAARLLRVPYIIHESDIVPGLTNRLLSGGAAAVAVGFPADRYRGFPQAKLHYTGSPIRRPLLEAHRLEGLNHFGFSERLPVVLVMGGSQGARVINQALVTALPRLVQKYQIIHLTGEREIEQVRFQVSRLRLSLAQHYQAQPYLADDLGLALAAADAAVSRAGANAIAELAALGKPTLLIPNPRLVGDHQTANAQVLSRADAVRVLPETKLTPAALEQEIGHILDSQQEQDRLSGAIKKFAMIDADERLADLILSVAGETDG